MDKQVNTQKWFLPFRLIQYIIIFGVVVIWMNYPNFMHLPFVAYSIMTLCFALFIATEYRHKLYNVTYFIVFCQILLEIIIESGVVYATGNVNSQFSILLILTIISASLIFRLIGTLLVASTVSLSYTFVIWFAIGGGENTGLQFNQALQKIYSTSDSLFYSIFIHVLIFYLVAFISGYLAERLRRSTKELNDTSRALKQAKLETDDILKNLNSGLLSIDVEGNIIYFNRAAENILGYKEEEVKGLPCTSVFLERMPELAELLVCGLEENIDFPRKELVIINNDMVETTPIGLSTSVLKEEDGTIRGVIAIFTDLTDAKQMESKIRMADRLAAVGELSASIAHEIRNPLASISGSVEVLKSELTVSEENEKLMNLIVKESDRLTMILDEFLIYARIDRTEYNKVELMHLISEVIDILYHHSSYHSDISVEIESDESIVYIIGDERLIKQLLLNLVMNAAEAIGNNPGQILFKVAVYESQQKVELFIQDSGPGIPEEAKKNIFKPFFSTKKLGTGLGLSIVHRICAAMRVPITVDSQLGVETVFMLEFSLYMQIQNEIKNQESKSAELIENS